jgi:hypothetical protein
MTATDEHDTAPLPETTCPHCDEVVPDAAFCGDCGAHLEDPDQRRGSRRAHAYSAFPDERVLRLSVVTSLLPQLGRRSRAPFQTAFGLAAVLLIALAAARLEAAVIAVSALSVPLLFLLYTLEIDPHERRFLVPSALVLVAGAALGVGWALLVGPIVSDALVPSLSPSLANSSTLESAVLGPAVGQLLMIVPVAVLRLRRPDRTEALDGFGAGVTGALGFTLAATLTELSSRLRDGNLAHGSVLTILTQAVVRGGSVPLVAAATTGYVAASLWARHGGASRAGAAWIGSPIVALAGALAIQVGLGFADDARISDAFLLVIHLVAAGLALIALRFGLHHVLLREGGDARTGAARACPNCLRLVPAMPYCPSCGVAERATALLPLPLLGSHTPKRHLVAGDTAASPRPRAAVAGAGGLDTRAPPTAAFPEATRAQVIASRRLGSYQLALLLLGGLAALCGLLVGLAVALPSTPPAPCTALSCFSPFGPIPLRQGHDYRSTEGWTDQWFPAAALLPQRAPSTTARATADELQLTFTNASSPVENGVLAITGLQANGHSAAELVTQLRQTNAPNAVLDYVVPGPTIGYEPAYGEAFATTPNSANGQSITYEVVVICAVRRDYAICSYAVGPRVSVAAFENHPTPAELALALWTNPELNDVRWPGESNL